MPNFHDLIIKGPNFPEGVRIDHCNDESIKQWIKYGLEHGATSFESMPSEEL